MNTTRSNVVKLTRRDKEERRSSSPPKPVDENAAIIRAAVTYAQSTVGFHAGFAVDPDGNNSTASDSGDRCERRAQSALAELARMKATTAAAIAAKARIVPIFLGDNPDFNETDQAFLVGLARDMHTFLVRVASDEVADGRTPFEYDFIPRAKGQAEDRS
jgi:hypothetical protein